MDSHYEAWLHVKKQLFGSVCEVALRTPWGFVNDLSSITNYTVNQFLCREDKFGTIIIHILSGEGLPKEKIIEVLKSAYNRCVKLIILEHNPESSDFTGLTDIKFYYDFLAKEKVITDNWGRNLLIYSTTMNPLHLPELTDKYYNENINKLYVNNYDDGINKKHLIYTHTSEKHIDFDLPDGTINWVIGGGLAYESMNDKNKNILFDSVLRQVLWCAKIYGVEKWKLDLLYDFSNVKIDSNYRQWRVVKLNSVKPDSIRHINIKNLKCVNETVYVSTIDKKYWEHLSDDNIIIDSFTQRDKPILVPKYKKHRVLVISSNMGKNLSNKMVKQKGYNVDFICLNDTNFPLRNKTMNPRLVAKIPKMLAWEMYPNYDYYLWMDSDCNINREDAVKWFIEQMNGADAAFFKHRHRNNVYQEMKFIHEKVKAKISWLSDKCEGEDMKGQVERYLKENWYKDDYLLEAKAFIYSAKLVKDRRYNVMKEWFYQVCIGSIRDQLSLPYVLQMFKVKFNVIKESVFDCKYLK